LEKLNKSTDIKRVKQEGKAFLHPLVVLILHPNSTIPFRYCVSTGRAIGNAVKRNRAKRILKEALYNLNRNYSFNAHTVGWDILIIARQPIIHSKTTFLIPVLESLFMRSGLIQKKQD